MRPDIAYIRLTDPHRGAVLEDWHPPGPTPPSGLAPALDALLASGGAPSTLMLPVPGGESTLCAVASPIGYLGEIGLLLVGSARHDFPTEEERIVIGVAANHAAIVVQRQWLEQQQRDFIAMVAHDLKNPLTTIKGYSQLLQRRGVYDERVVATIVTQTDRLEGLIDDLRDMARIDAEGVVLHREYVDLTALARRCVEEAQTLSEAHAVHMTAPKEPVIGWWDGGRLTQVMANILTNAVKYSPDGGEIYVEVKAGGGMARVAVRDTGIGMTPDVVARVFDRFYRAERGIAVDRKGLGLGLSISKALVEAHGGRIAVESTPAGGSTFRLSLPQMTQSRPQ